MIIFDLYYHIFQKQSNAFLFFQNVLKYLLLTTRIPLAKGNDYEVYDE